jgi:glycosyltransferase involved in cell wall biosynthesis
MDARRGSKLKVVLSVDQVQFPLTGIGRYAYELALGLQKTGINKLKFLRGTRIQTTLASPSDTAPLSQLSQLKSLAKKSQLAVSMYRKVNPWLKAQALKGLEDHVFHGPSYYLPPFGGQSVVTIHDLSIFQWPQCHPPERVSYMRAEIELSLKRATALITDTEFTRQEVSKYFGWSLDRVYAVPLASGPAFRLHAQHELKPILNQFGLKPQGYTLFTGTIEPRKNIGLLLDAYAQLSHATRLRWPLVVCGYQGWNSADLHVKLKTAESQGWLRYLGFVPNDDLPVLMAGARLFSFPSFYEGFGLPVLEAMACGVPVVCSNASTLPEVAGDAAGLHDPEDCDMLIALLQRGLEDEVWRAKATHAGLAQAAKYSWERCTKQTMDVYRAITRAA